MACLIISMNTLNLAEKVTNYAAVIVEKENPQLEKIIKDFDDFIGFFQNKPQT